MSEIDVTFVCWPNHPARLGYARHCFATVFENLAASRHQLVFRCSLESEHDPRSQWMGDELQSLCDSCKMPLHWREGKADLGAAMNSALRLGTSPFTFLIQDDFELLYPCDLSPGADLMDAEPTLDLIRYGWPPMIEFCGELRGWPVINVGGMWCYGDEPQLRRRSFQDKWGWFTEYHTRHGQSETELLGKMVADNAKISVADKMYFGNFGAISAVPATKEYREREVKR